MKFTRNSELMTCPFCGAQPSGWIEDDDNRSLILHISCGNCPARMDMYLAFGSKEPFDERVVDECIRTWNKRQLEGRLPNG